jgi:hypothetical protein
MISSGYFTPRKEILEWINDLLITNVTSVEQLGAGNIYCQMLDAAYPEKVPLGKVKWQAYLEVDFLFNFKILQSAFQRLGIAKSFDVRVQLCRRRSWPRPNTKTTWSSCSGLSGNSTPSFSRTESTTQSPAGITKRSTSYLTTRNPSTFGRLRPRTPRTSSQAV